MRIDLGGESGEEEKKRTFMKNGSDVMRCRLLLGCFGSESARQMQRVVMNALDLPSERRGRFGNNAVIVTYLHSNRNGTEKPA